MTDLVQMFSGVSDVICAALIALVVFSRKVQEGPVIKLGLILMTMGLLASGVITLKGFDTMYGLWNASLMLRVGLLVALLGYGWRVDFQHKGKT